MIDTIGPIAIVVLLVGMTIFGFVRLFTPMKPMTDEEYWDQRW